MSLLVMLSSQHVDKVTSAALHADRQQQQDDSAAGVSAYATSHYDRDARMADAFEPEEFRGMLFHDGVDSQGRPVIVVNTDAVGTTRKARAQALQYMLHRLEPIVVQVCFESFVKPLLSGGNFFCLGETSFVWGKMNLFLGREDEGRKYMENSTCSKAHIVRKLWERLKVVLATLTSFSGAVALTCTPKVLGDTQTCKALAYGRLLDAV